jgi:hypothetical protein
LYEVEGKDVFTALVSEFPGYAFQITEGSQTQEILVGVRNTLTAFFTQKIEFKSGVTLMRPGLLTTITTDNVNYSLLFLHLASKTEPRGMGLRDDMIGKAMEFRHTLDKAYNGHHKANYIFLGDLNTMGMDYPFKRNIKPKFELQKWDEKGKKTYGMRRLKKTSEKTWGSVSKSKIKTSNLDHVYAAEHLEFTKFLNPANKETEVEVRGWVSEKTTEKRGSWIKSFSDHSLLYFEVQKA